MPSEFASGDQSVEKLRRELAEAREQQAATSELLKVIGRTTFDLQPVFQTLAENAVRLCEAERSFIFRFDGQYLRVVATHNASAEVRAFVERNPIAPGRASATARAALHRRTIHVLDAQSDPEYTYGSRQVDPFRTILTVPILKADELLGVILIYRHEVRAFTDSQIALLETFAAHAVIAMENARLITETREALEQQTATAEVLQVINSSPGNLDPVFDATLESATRLCDAAFAILWLCDGERFHAAALHGVPARYAEVARVPCLPSPSNPLGRMLRGERLITSLDAAADDLYRTGDPVRRALVDLGRARSFIQVALVKDDVLLGSLTVYRQQVRAFSEKEIALLGNFAAQAVIAIENARLLGELRARTDEIAGWNRELEERVAAQLAEIERTGKLRRFLAPQLADLIVAQGDESILESHRRQIVVVFCDLRGFTGFAERAEPEEVMALLRDYHAAMGPIVASFEGTLDHYAGDGIMVFFNDPLPTPDPARRAINMAVAMRAAAQDLLRSWRRRGHDIGFGVGISQGYATLGQIGFAERMDYTAIGTVTNLAARLCAEAKDGQILIGARVAIAVEDSAELEEIGDLSLKGLSQAVAVYNVPQ